MLYTDSIEKLIGLQDINVTNSVQNAVKSAEMFHRIRQVIQNPFFCLRH